MRNQFPVSGNNDVFNVPQFDESLKEVVDRIGIVLLTLCVNDVLVCIDGNPGGLPGIFINETCIGCVIPLHGSSRIIATLESQRIHHFVMRQDPRFFDVLPVVVQGFDVAILVEAGKACVRHTQFFALVDVGGSLVHVKDEAKCLCASRAQFFRGVVSPPGHDARLVVVAVEEAGPATIAHDFFVASKDIA